MWERPSSTPVAARISGGILVVLFLAIAVLLSIGIWLLLPGPFHFLALLGIGVIALVFGFVSYFAQALTRAPAVPRAMAWGFSAFGFGILFLSVTLLPFLYGRGFLSVAGEIVALIVLILLLMAVVAGIGWGARSRVQTDERAAHRAAWSSRSPPSAFSYAAGQPPVESPPSASPSPPPPGGA